MSDTELSGLLDKLNKTQKESAKSKAGAIKAEDAWVAKFNKQKDDVIRPTFEILGQKVRAHGHDFNIVETPFLRTDTRAMPIEGSIRIDLYLDNERTRTIIGQDRRPGLKFSTHHRSQMVQVTICDITSRGGVSSKIGDFPLEKIDAAFVKDKFVALFKRLIAQHPADQPGGRSRGR
jgi:hypothetical protein